jgi:hypothetical protein
MHACRQKGFKLPLRAPGGDARVQVATGQLQRQRVAAGDARASEAAHDVRVARNGRKGGALLLQRGLPVGPVRLEQSIRRRTKHQTAPHEPGLALHVGSSMQ